MKKIKRTPRSKEVVIDVTESDYQRELAQGVQPEYALKPGRHVFRRGGFRERHPDFDRAKAETKVRVNMYLDGDIVRFFKHRASSAMAAPYQTQINAVLREYMKHVERIDDTDGVKARTSDPERLWAKTKRDLFPASRKSRTR